jgi:hypothetical protein
VEVGEKCRNTERKCRSKKRKYGSKEMGFLWCEGGSVCGLDEEKKVSYMWHETTL